MQRITLISEHACRLAAPRSGDTGGQNVYVAHLSGELSTLGYLVDICRRRAPSCLLRMTTVVMLAALPMALLWPYWQHTFSGGLAQYLVSAIYEFPSDEMPRCEQFVRHTDAAGMIGPEACETSPTPMMV